MMEYVQNLYFSNIKFFEIEFYEYLDKHKRNIYYELLLSLKIEILVSCEHVRNITMISKRKIVRENVA